MKRSTTANLIVAVHLIIFSAPIDVSAQSLDNKTATYILSGIAGLYTLITCFCFLIIVCICCKGHRKSRNKAKKYGESEDSTELLQNPNSCLSPIYEDPELESPVNVDEKESSFFENKYAEDFEERDAEVVVIEEEKDNKEATIIVNRVARDIHLMRKEHNLKFQGSPLGRHTPKILPHPIKVPYSEEASSNDESEYDTTSVTQVSILSWREPPNSKQQGDKQNVPSVSVSKEDGQLRMRKFDSSSYAAERRKEITPSTKNSPQIKVDKASLKVMTSPTDIIKTSPLPRSDYAKDKAIDKTITLNKLHAELGPVVEKWYYIGIQLKVPNKTLNAIRVINNKNTDVCMMRVCEEWFGQQNKCNKVPEWKTIVDVLKSRVISESKLADSLHDKYCSDALAESDEENEPKSKSYTWIN